MRRFFEKGDPTFRCINQQERHRECNDAKRADIEPKHWSAYYREQDSPSIIEVDRDPLRAKPRNSLQTDGIETRRRIRRNGHTVATSSDGTSAPKNNPPRALSTRIANGFFGGVISDSHVIGKFQWVSPANRARPWFHQVESNLWA